MNKHREAAGFICATLAALLVSAGPSFAAGLPNGATSLKETYGNWTVNCRAETKQESKEVTVTCNVEQEQLRSSDRQRLLLTSIVPGADGTAKGLFLLPFGLAVDQGVTLQIDTGPVTKPLPFKTCVVKGCIVQFDWPKATIDGLRTSNTLKLGAKTADGKAAPFTIPLGGFADANDRVNALIEN
jgi:invasion protein IalB